MFVCGGGIGCLGCVFILGKSITRQAQFFHHRNHLLRIETAILVAWSGVELDGFRFPFREEVFASIAELQIFASCGFVGFGVVLLDESACAAHQKQFHQFLPIVDTGTLLKCLNATDEYFTMSLKESTVTTQRADVFLRADTQVIVFADE